MVVRRLRTTFLPMTICSEWLELIPMSADFLRASLRRDTAAAEGLIQASVPMDWPDISDVLAFFLRKLENEPSLEPWLMRGMVLRSSRTMIGHIGFHSAPGADYLQPFSPAGVEFGFTVFPPFRRRGYAREASQALMDWAREVHGVQSFVLSISPDNIASQALAARLGFVRIGSHMDEEDGLEDILERRCSANPP